MIDVTEFQQRLAETMAWFSQYSFPDPSMMVLRSPELTPRIESLSSFEIPDALTPDGRPRDNRDKRYYSPTSAEIESVVNDLAVTRRNLLRARISYPTSTATELERGRLLAFSPKFTLSDGYSAQLTDYFLDDDDSPPWDTWICWVQEEASSSEDGELQYWSEEFLVSWVPQVFLTPVHEAVYMNRQGALIWVSELTCAFTEQLSQHGLLA